MPVNKTMRAIVGSLFIIASFQHMVWAQQMNIPMYSFVQVNNATPAHINSEERKNEEMMMRTEKPDSALYSDSLYEEIREAAIRLTKLHKVPGLAVALIRNGKIAWMQSIGYADLEKQKPVTEQTVFNVGSISKVVAAWGMMQLVEQEQIQLDQPVNKLLTRWKLPQSDFDESGVTLRRVLSHTAGLSVHGYGGVEQGEKVPSLEESLSGASNSDKKVRVIYQPGTKWQYSGGGYTLMQLLLEEKTKKDYAVYMKNNVLQPLGMKSSDFRWTDQLVANAATPYDENGKPIKRRTFTELAAAGLQTTLTDLAQFAVLSMTSDPELLKGVLKPETVRLMQQKVPPSSTEGESGLGYQLMNYGGLTTVGHTGENAGWFAGMFLHPSSKSGLVMLSNGSNGLQVMIPIYTSWTKSLQAKENK